MPLTARRTSGFSAIRGLKGKMKVEIVNRQTKPVPRKRLHQWVAGVERALNKRKVALLAPDGAKASTLRVVFVGTKEGKALNKQFRGKDYATDILSFEGMEPGELGELIICLPVIARQAKEHQLTQTRELEYMVLHGILHLLGYDHEKSDKEARRMYRLQDDIFAELE